MKTTSKQQRNKYPQLNVRLNEQDLRRLGITKQRYRCETSIEAIRIALYIVAEKTPIMRVDKDIL